MQLKTEKRMPPARRAALGGVVTALTVASLYLAAMLPAGRAAWYFVASLLVAALLCEGEPLLATLCFAAVPEVIAKPEQNGMACGVVNTLEKVGVFLSTILFGALIEVVGWTVTFYIMAPICILGIISVFINKKLK